MMQLSQKFEGWPNFPLDTQSKLGKLCNLKNLKDYHAASYHIWQLPYKRTSNPTDLSCVLQESCGTCSGKHAFLAELAHENRRFDITLQIIIFKLHLNNSPSFKGKLTEKIDSFPEAHCRLIYHDHPYDFTFPDRTTTIDPENILELHQAMPSQIPKLKHELHQALMLKWSFIKGIEFQELWNFRKAYIEWLMTDKTS